MCSGKLSCVDTGGGGAFARVDLVSTIGWWVGGAVSARRVFGGCCVDAALFWLVRVVLCARGFLCVCAEFSCVGLCRGFFFGWGLHFG